MSYKARFTADFDLEKEVVVFLNYHEGGSVYIGINKTGSTLGLSDSDGDAVSF
ncbi:MAG: putative DNA binding domain-containing protein [Flavobacteriaceae bacterium]|nr:putative DNA binding domain-containing protein [Flavobacteriaceae bacterium]